MLPNWRLEPGQAVPVTAKLDEDDSAQRVPADESLDIPGAIISPQVPFGLTVTWNGV